MVKTNARKHHVFFRPVILLHTPSLMSHLDFSKLHPQQLHSCDVRRGTRHWRVIVCVGWASMDHEESLRNVQGIVGVLYLDRGSTDLRLDDRGDWHPPPPLHKECRQLRDHATYARATIYTALYSCRQQYANTSYRPHKHYPTIYPHTINTKCTHARLDTRESSHGSNDFTAVTSNRLIVKLKAK